MLALRLIKRLSSLGLVVISLSVMLASATLVMVPQARTMVTSYDGTYADLELNELAERSVMYGTDGEFLTYLSEQENREPIALEDISQPVVDAILALEDTDFYNHSGLNFRGTFRALVENLNQGGVAQGGSTITQQLVKNALLSPEQNLNRKAIEAVYATRLEKQLSKDEILERYLNTVYFGSNAYGVQAAAETYWGYESASQLGWAEAALLAGIIRNPTLYDPTRFPKHARARREVVLDRLVVTGDLTREQAEELSYAPLPDERETPYDIEPKDYFTEQALSILLSDPTYLKGDQASRYAAIYRGGLKIYTTFDPEVQAEAVAARDKTLGDDDTYSMAIVTLDNRPEKSGAVRAIIGGREFEKNNYNIATDGIGRQPGSTMKTVVLATAFEMGYIPEDQIRGDTVSIEDPTVPGGVYSSSCKAGGYHSLAAMTRQSNNCAFLRLGQVVGLDRVVAVSRRLGLKSLDPQGALVNSLPLGVKEVTPMQMTAAYAAMANDGMYNEPWYIERIEDRDGNVIYEHTPNPTRAITQETARLLTEVLISNVEAGTGWRAQVPDHVTAGKTGTTQNHWDAWFAGYTGSYTTVLWLGNPNEQSGIVLPGWGRAFGGGPAAATWGAYMTAVHQGLEPIGFETAKGIRDGKFLRVRGELDYCDGVAIDEVSNHTQLVDSNADGHKDCFVPLSDSGLPVDGALND